MFSCKSRYACGGGGHKSQYSDSDEDSSYGFKATTDNRGNRTRAVLRAGEDTEDHPDYHIYGNVTFGYKPILKTRLSSAASSSTRRRPPVKRTVSFSGVESSGSPDVRRRSLRLPLPPYSVAVRRAASFSATRRNAAEIVARRQRMPLPHENDVVTSSCNVTRVMVDVHQPPSRVQPNLPRPHSIALSVSTDLSHDTIHVLYLVYRAKNFKDLCVFSTWQNYICVVWLLFLCTSVDLSWPELHKIFFFPVYQF